MRTVVCGIGNRMRGDDAAGPMVIDELKKTLTSDGILLLDCGDSPESFMKRILDFKPEKLMLIDTADFGGKPGSFRTIDTDSVRKQSLSTHRMPLTLMLDYLKSRISLETVLIGIQPKHTGLGKPVSEECRDAVRRLGRVIEEMVR